MEREVSGEGQWVNTSLLQAQIFMLDFQAARWLQMDEVAKQAGNNHPTSIPTGVFKTKDGHINIAAAGQIIWERLCQALGAPEFIDHPEYKTGALRSKNRNAVNSAIEAITVAKSERGLDRHFQQGRRAVRADQQHRSGVRRRAGQTLADCAKRDRPDGKEQVFVGQPVVLSRTPSKIVVTPPSIGQHTDEVLKEFGFADNEIAALHDAKAV